MPETKKPRVLILTSLTDFSSAYSIGRVTHSQVAMLQRHGHEVVVLCCKNFNARDKMDAPDHFIFEGPAVPLCAYDPSSPPDDRWGDQVAAFKDCYSQAVSGFDVVITHDLMFLDTFLPMNQAIRDVAETAEPGKTWLHWIHSGPSVPPPTLCYPSTLRFSAMPESKYIFLNKTDRQNFANMIGAPPGTVRVVYNPVDIRDQRGFSEETREFIDRYGLLRSEITQTYPISVTRWKDKGIRQLLRIWGQWKQDGHTARLVIVNAHSNGDGQKSVDELEAYAEKCGLEMDSDVVLTSRFCGERKKDQRFRTWDYSVPKYVVDELAQISNMFIFPSISECCSLVQAESALASQFVVLNRDFPPMLEFADRSVLNFNFTANNPDDMGHPYYACAAREIYSEFARESSVQNATFARVRTYNSDVIWREQLEPLLYRS